MMGNVHIGVTPTKGALTPAYNPLLTPSLAILFFTTSSALEYTPLSAVCSRTFTRSKGCPTITAHTPPNPPAAKLLSPASDFFSASWIVSCNCCLVSGTWGSLEEMAAGRAASMVWLICAPAEEEEGEEEGAIVRREDTQR